MPHEFEAQDADLRNAAFPQLVKANGSAIPVMGYSFDAAAIETIFFRFRASDYTSGDVAVDLDWYADTATSNAVVWGAQLAAITTNSDSQNVETDALPTVITTTTNVPTNAQAVARTTITLTGAGLDSLATGDHCVLAVSRQATNGSDTATGDAILLYVSIAA